MDRYLTMNIEYDVPNGSFKITGDVKEGAHADLLEAFLRDQIGAGEDKREANEADVYHISLRWHPNGDIFESRSDTGNLGLRDGILWDILSRLDKHNPG